MKGKARKATTVITRWTQRRFTAKGLEKRNMLTKTQRWRKT
jgi:hypothetical protein